MDFVRTGITGMMMKRDLHWDDKHGVLLDQWRSADRCFEPDPFLRLTTRWPTPVDRTDWFDRCCAGKLIYRHLPQCITCAA